MRLSLSLGLVDSCFNLFSQTDKKNKTRRTIEMPTPQAPPPKVVILGAGYAGALLAKNLDPAAKKGLITLIVIERRDSMHHKIGSIRASVRGGEWVDRVRIPLSRVVRYGKVVIGNVAHIDRTTKTVSFSDATVPDVVYDILIAATGARSHNPGDLPVWIRNKDDIREYMRETAQIIKNAKDVLIVGGGASAVEYAGEIRSAFPEKAVTIVASSAHLLSSSVAPMTPKFMKALYETLEARNIKVIRAEKVVLPEEGDFSQRPYEKGPITVRTKGENNYEFTTDLLLWAATWTIDATIYPQEWLNEIGELSISPTFQVVDQDDVLAVGDVSSLCETKQAITLPAKMNLIVNNVLVLAAAMRANKFVMGKPVKGIKNYKINNTATMYLPVGPVYGVSQVKGYVYGDKKTSEWKGKDLYSNMFWKILTDAEAPVTGVFDEKA